MNNNPSMAGIASLVQSRGRNGDSMLVHMAPEEVKGLQSLALAAGGSLSINPDTGLVEANFLKKLLPTLLGFGLNFLFPGLGALGSGLLVGAGETIRTGGDLGRGLMAGLGAFGGAGLGSALAGAGAVAGGAGQAGITAAGEAAAAEAAKQGAQQAAIEAAKKKAIEEATKKAVAEQAATKGIASGATGWQNIKAGAGSLFKTSPGIGALGGADALGATFNALPGGMIGKAGLVTSAANVLTPDMEVPGGGYDIDDSYYESYGYSPEQGRFLGGQWRKGYPGFPGYAMGGQVSPPPNYSYPQANISKSNYAPSVEYTKPREVLDGYDTKIDPFTGEETFADGGQVGIGALVPPPPIIDPGPQQGMFPPPPPIIDPGPQQPMPITPLPEEPYGRRSSGPPPPPGMMVNPNYGKPGQDYYIFNDGVPSASAPRMERPEPIGLGPMEPGVSAPRLPMAGEPGFGTSQGLRPSPLAAAPQQSMEQYYQSLLAPPQQRPVDNSFANYMQGLNQFVTSPIAPPPPPPQPPQTPPSKPPGDDRVTGTGGTGTGMRWDPTQGKFVPGTGSPGDTGIDFSELQNLVNSGMFSGFNFGDLGNYLQNGGYGDTSGLNWDPVSGSFMRPGSQTAFTPPGSTDQTDLSMNQSQFNPNQFQFDPNSYQFNPFVEGFDMSSLPGYNVGQGMPDMGMNAGMGMPGMDMPQGNLTNINQFAEPMYSGMDFGQGDQQNVFGFAGGGTIQKAAAGKLVTGDGDGMSDDIRANISGNQEARLADGEFVIPADVVSHLGNGSTDAGADRLYSMMDRIRKARTGRTKQAPEIDAEKYLPA